MKKFTKLIGIFLALSLVIGMIPVVGAVDPEPTAPAAPTGAILQGTTYEVVSPTRIETSFGYYEDGTGVDEGTFVDKNDGYCVTDGWFGRAGYSECTSADGLIALIMMVDDIVNLGGIEIVCKDAAHAAAKFDIQVLGAADWETVVTVDANPFTDCLTQTFTFDAVETDTVRILVREVATNDQCYFHEVTLLEEQTGNLTTKLDLTGKMNSNNFHANYPAAGFADGDKSNFVLGSNAIFTFDGATAIDGFNLYPYRNDSHKGNTFASSVTINAQKTEGGEFETIGTFETGWTSEPPTDALYVTFDQTVMAYAVQVIFDVNAYVSEFELFQYQREGTEPTPTEEPTPAPTEEPTPAPTEEPTPAPTQPALPGNTYLQLIPESSLTPYVGDYVDGNFETLVNQDPGEAAYLTDVAIGSAGWIGSQSTSGVQAAVIELGGTKLVGGVELIARLNDYLTQFEIQVKTTNGTWVTVKNVTEDPFDGCRSVMYTFDPVEASAIRVLCYAWSSNRPMLQEIAVYEVKTGVMMEVVPSGVTSPQGAVLAETTVDNVIDGFRGNYTYDYFQTPATAAQLTFDLIKDGTGSSINRVVIYAFATDKYAPASITLTLETAEGLVTVYNDVAYTSGATDTFILDLDQTYGAYSAILTINSTLASEVLLTEVDFFGNGEPVAPPTVTPTEPTGPVVPSAPTEPEVTEPEATEPEATEPEATEPEATEPEATEPEATEPEATEPQPTTAPIGNTWLDLIGESTITPAVGYFVGEDYTTLTDINNDESPLLTNANVGNDTWINGNDFTNSVPAGKTPGAILDLGANKLIGALELVGAAGKRITAFDIAILDANGVWQDVYTTTDAPYVGSTLKVVLDNPVEGSKIRLVIHDWSDAHPVLKEIFVYEAKTTDPLVKVPVANISATQEPVIPAQGIENILNGDKFSYYQIGPGNMPVAINFDVTNPDGTATNVSRMRIFAYAHNKYAPGEIVVEVKTANEPETWETVYTGTAYTAGLTDTFTLDFGATYAAYDVRLTVNSFIANNLILNEVELFGNGEPVAPPVVDPTDPTEPEATEPTQPTEPEEEPGNDLDYSELEESLAILETMDPADYTDESVAEFNAILEQVMLVYADENATQEMIDEATEMLLAAMEALVPIDESGDEPGEDLPEVPELPGAPDLTEIQATIDRIYDLNPDLFTAESYKNLIAVVKEVNKILANEDGYTQKMIDSANAMLIEALEALILIDGETDVPGGEDPDEDLPAPTGDIALAVLSGLMSLSAVGGAVVIGKKKFF